MDHVGLVSDLLRRIDIRILDPLEIALSGGPEVAGLRDRLRIEAEAWAAQLLGPDERQAGSAAARIIAVLFDGDTAFDPPDEWWSTPLGRAIAVRTGHPTAKAVSYATAGAMLGITRQGVHDLVKRGKLARDPDGGVTAESVTERLKQRTAHPLNPQESHVSHTH